MGDSVVNNSLYNRELLKGRFYPKTKAYYFKEWDNFRMDFHGHNAVEIMYVINGSCLVEVRDASIAMKKGELILLDANVEHRLQVEKEMPCRMLNIEFGFCEMGTLLPSYADVIQGSLTLKQLLRSGIPYFVMKDSEEVYVTLKSLIMELDRDDSVENTLIGLLFDQLLIRLSRLYCEAADKLSGSGVIYVKKALQFIHQNYDRNIRIKDIAAAVNIHPGYLHRIFKSNKGCTINDYLIKVRIEKAKSLLANTDIKISDISEYVGMNSRQYFAFAFKQYTGQSPSSYRETLVIHDAKKI